MGKQFNKLSPAQAERLFLLLEELGEVQQAIGKILRHGYDSCHPNLPCFTNQMHLESELGDVAAAVQLLTDIDLEAPIIESARVSKLERVQKYLHHQNEEATK